MTTADHNPETLSVTDPGRDDNDIIMGDCGKDCTMRFRDDAFDTLVDGLLDYMKSYKHARTELEEFMSTAQDYLEPDEFDHLVEVLKSHLPTSRFTLASM